MKKKILILILSLIGINAFAAGQGGSGGYPDCIEFTNTVGQIASTLMTIGQASVDKVNAIIQVKQLWQIKQTPLRCIPVVELDRQARSYPNEVYTKLLVTKYNGLKPWEDDTRAQQIELAAHELAVLAKYETDGESFVSDSIVQLVMAKWNESRADQVIQNPDGSTTFYIPYIIVDGNAYSFGDECHNVNADCAYVDQNLPPDQMATGVCLHFGFRNLISSYTTSVDYDKGQSFADMDASGHLLGVWTPHKGDGVVYLRTVTCE